MRLVKVDSNHITKDLDIVSQYLALRKIRFPSADDKPGTAQDSYSFLLLVDDNNKLMAGAMLTNGNRFANGRHLPKSLNCPIGYVTCLASASDSGMFMPGMYLQERIIEEFKRGALGVDILVADIAQTNMPAAQEAFADSGLHSVVRDDLNKESVSGASTSFIAVTADPNIKLTPDGYEQHVVPTTELRERAHEELLKLKQNRRKTPSGQAPHL